MNRAVHVRFCEAWSANPLGYSPAIIADTKERLLVVTTVATGELKEQCHACITNVVQSSIWSYQ